MTELGFDISYSMIDPNRHLKFNSLLGYFQDTADVDATKFGLSVSQLLPRRITWILRKYRIDIKKYPTAHDKEIVVKTYAELYDNLFSLRTFEMRNGNGEELGRAFSWWILLDIERGRPIRLDKCEFTLPFSVGARDNLPCDVKVGKIGAECTKERFKVRWQDLDVNNHTNHTVYINWALESVPREVPETFSPYFVEVEYLKPTPRTTVKILTEELQDTNGRRFLHSICTDEDDKEHARLLIIWR